jgi:phospholipid/cholesterol/gamma-HCH transport system substrate-binding protein
LSGNKALITFEVLKRIKVPIDSRLRIKTVGFLGDKYLDIIVGEKEDRLAENSLIESQESGGIGDLTKNAAALMDDVKSIVAELRITLVPEGKPGPIFTMLEDFKAIAKNTKDATQKLDEMLGTNGKKFASFVSNLENFSEKLSYHMEIGNKDAVIRDIKDIMAEAKEAISGLNVVMSNMRKGKGTIGKFLVEDGIADEVKQTLAGVNKMVNKVNSLKTELYVFSGADSLNGATARGGLRIYPSPDRFYQLGLVSAKFGAANERVYEEEINGVTTVTNKKETVKNTFRFSVQIGRKFNDWIFRGGWIESSAGIGVDYEIFGRRWFAGAEVYDYDEDMGGINTRLYTEFLLWNVLYGRLSTQDFRKKITGTAMMGLRFNDDDIKSLLGYFF